MRGVEAAMLPGVRAPTEGFANDPSLDQIKPAAVVEGDEARPLAIKLFVEILVENFRRNMAVAVGVDDHESSDCAVASNETRISPRRHEEHEGRSLGYANLSCSS